MISSLLASAALAGNGPAVDASAGFGLFSPMNRPHWVNPSLDGQVDVSELVPGVPWLGATGGVQLGSWLPRGCGGSCTIQGKWGLGVGPGVVTRHVDATVQLRVVGFGSGTNLRSAVQVAGKVAMPGVEALDIRPFVGIEGLRYADLLLGVRIGARVREPEPEPMVVEVATAAGGGVGTVAACPAWTVVGASMSPVLLTGTVLAAMSTTEALERRLALERELAELEAAEASHQEMEAFRTSLRGIEDVLKDNAADTEAATAKIDEIKASVEKLSEVVGAARSLLQTDALDGVLHAADGTSDAAGRISEGVGQLGERSKAAAEAIDQLSSMLDELNELQEMDATRSGDLIRGFNGVMGGLVETLGPFVELVPGVGAFLEIYQLAIENIAVSVDSIIDTMLTRNRQARQAGLSDVYTFTPTATQKRRCRIAEIRSELGQLELETAVQPAGTTLTAEERARAVDVRNAFESGLRASGIGDGAASPYDGWSQAERRLRRARNRLALAHERAGSRHRGIEAARKDLEKAEADRDRAKAALDEAQKAYDAASMAGSDSGKEIVRTLEARDAANTRFREADRTFRVNEGRVDGHAEALEELKAAREEYGEAHEVVRNVFDTMVRQLPAEAHFDAARESLTEQHAPDGSFEEHVVPEVDAFLEGLQ